MSRARARFASSLLVATFLAAGCAPLPKGPGEVAGGDEGAHRNGGALVLGGSSLQGRRGSLLDAMQSKLPSFRTRLTSGECPHITLRRSTGVPGNPSVYVDGTHATDTCILQSLRATDTERVEVYPMGVTARPGYGTESRGLILVFMRAR